MSRILFYSPFNQRSRDTESLMIAFKKEGHGVVSLSQNKGEFIHQYLNSQGIETFSYVIPFTNSIVYFFKHILFFIRFCNKNKTDIIYSHLEPANFVASIAQYFIKAKVYIVRHHVDEGALQGFDKSFFYRVTYSLAKKIIVVSNRARDYMVQVEGIRSSKILKINLAYDFSLYAAPDLEAAGKIRENAAADLLLLTACRFTKYKRADCSVRIIRKLVDRGIDAKLILLGSGEEEANLKELIAKLGIMDRVVMPGYINNMTDFLAASDMLLHPSLLESSCVIVKEAAITNVPVIVCRDVGDFNDYIINEENAFMLEQSNFLETAVEIIVNNYKNKKELERIASNLKSIVLDLFGVGRIIKEYKELNV